MLRGISFTIFMVYDIMTIKLYFREELTMEADPDPANITSQLILIVILTFLNAFFASAEMAIVSLNKTKMKMLAEDGNKKAELLLKLMESPTKFLSTVQVGITLAGFFSSASAATGLSGVLAQFLDSINIPYSGQVALIVVTIILSYITLVFGELFPKRLALQKSEEIAMFSVMPILYVSKITLPFVKLLSASTTIMIRIFGLESEGLDEKVSREEIKSLVEVGQETGVINETEKEMINSIFEFDDKLANEVMTPRTEVYLININTPLNEYLDELIEERYSRVPVYEARKHGFENVDIRSIIHQPHFVPETKNIDELFKELQAFKKHMAVLIDEYGGFSGIVSIEDLIEEVMGNIEDEYDDDEPEMKKIDNNTFIINGMLSIDDFNDYFHAKIESEDYDTISGFIIDLLGRIPSSTDEKSIEYENLVFKIEEIKSLCTK
jgi:putative hemolysin